MPAQETGDPVAQARAMTAEAHELAPKLYAIGLELSIEDATRLFEGDNVNLEIRDIWARVAGWHLREILRVQEATARAIHQRLGADAQRAQQEILAARARRRSTTTPPFVCPVEIRVVDSGIIINIGEEPAVKIGPNETVVTAFPIQESKE